jgi:GGDEF domain-containing protein
MAVSVSRSNAAAPKLVEAGLDRPLFLGVRRSALIEIVAYLTLILVVDYFGFNGDRFREVNPHPFWPLILLISVQYGTAEGLIAAAFCTVALLAGNVPEQSINQDLYEYFLSFASNPVLWLVSSLVIGEIRTRHIHERQKLEEQLALTMKSQRELGTAYERLTAINTSLESRIASQMRTAVSMYEATRALEQSHPSEVLLGVVDTVSAVMNPEKFSLYLLLEDRLEISIGRGWKSNDTHSRVFASSSNLFQEIIGRQRILCAANPEDERILASEGVLAGPLVDNAANRVIGMLKIEQLGFFDLHFSNVQTFKVLCEWIADSYLNAQRLQERNSQQYIDGITGVATQALFIRERDFLIRLAQRIGFDVSMVVVRLENLAEVGESRATIVPIMLREVAQRVLRSTDILFEHQSGSQQYCVVLPNTTITATHVVAEKLRVALELESQTKLKDARYSVCVQEIYRRDTGGSQ